MKLLFFYYNIVFCFNLSHPITWYTKETIKSGKNSYIKGEHNDKHKF
jgi:hypothetical protein